MRNGLVRNDAAKERAWSGAVLVLELCFLGVICAKL
jgi:hypothetical protein